MPCNILKDLDMLTSRNRYVIENDFGEHWYHVRTKWKKTTLKWYFPQATPPYVAAAEKAFDIWQQNSKFTFKRVLIPVPSPDLTITIVNEKHQFRANCQGNEYCAFNFDGPGKVLAHAYFPSGDGCIEIRFDRNERWNPNIDGIVQDTETNFFLVLAHEIGHTLGIGHGDVSTAIMFPWYQKNITMLDEDDKMALESLYGPTQKFIHNPYNEATTTTTMQPTQPPLSHQPPVMQTNICDIKAPDFMFLASSP
ncbi:matrix metalloproteinase-2-like [Diorhabda sublineata]|uniref:matrix metalloproteinase-2-like n=1 Tax=Diorhabda sublineata TaxID=1163346 RepID=UPI0024E0CBCD|nr:matrix metalloproteinase-2-like [Diorhabda sublineata]